jgi:hypothetical protein
MRAGHACIMVTYVGHVCVSITCQKRPTICQKRHNTCQKRPTTCQKRHTICRKRPATCQKRPATCQKRPATCQKRPATCQKRPTTCQKRPTVTSTCPTTNDSAHAIALNGFSFLFFLVRGGMDRKTHYSKFTTVVKRRYVLEKERYRVFPIVSRDIPHSQPLRFLTVRKPPTDCWCGRLVRGRVVVEDGGGEGVANTERCFHDCYCFGCVRR